MHCENQKSRTIVDVIQTRLRILRVSDNQRTAQTVTVLGVKMRVIPAVVVSHSTAEFKNFLPECTGLGLSDMSAVINALRA